MSWLGVWLGPRVPTVEVAQQVVVHRCIFPITFVSNAFVPLAEPADLAPAVRRMEPDQHPDLVAPNALGQPEPVPADVSLASTEPILVTLIWFAIILGVFAPLGVRRYSSMSR